MTKAKCRYTMVQHFERAFAAHRKEAIPGASRMTFRAGYVAGMQYVQKHFLTTELKRAKSALKPRGNK